MQINLATLPMNKSVSFEEEIDFRELTFKNLNLKQINKCEVTAVCSQYESLLRVEVNVKASLTCISAYSLKDVPLNVDVNDELDFAEDINENENLISNNLLNLDEYVISLILASIPKRVIDKGEKLPKGGQGYRVLSEEDLIEERKSRHTSAFDCLDDLDL